MDQVFDCSNDGNVEGSFLGDSLGLEVETELGSFHVGLDGNEYGMLWVSSLGESLGYTSLFVLHQTRLI